MYISTNEDGKAAKKATMGVASLGAGIGAIREVGKLRDKINKKYAEDCAKADAQGLPRPPKPDTSTKTLMAILKGSIKGAIVGTGVSFIPGVGRALKDTAATLQATTNKFITGNKFGAVSFSFMNTFLPTREFSEAEKYTLTYLTDKDFAEINLSNLDIGDVTGTDLLKCFFSLAKIAGQVYDRQSLQQYFANKSLAQDNPYVEEDAKILGLSNAAMPVLGAIGGGVYGGIKARKRALEKWEQECKIADAKGLPRPPKPSILGIAGAVGKNAAVGGGIGMIGRKFMPTLNSAISAKLDDYGLTGFKNLKRAHKEIARNTKDWINQSFSVSFNQYRAALARKGQYTTLTEEQFNNCPPEYYDILIRNMQPMNFSEADPTPEDVYLTAEEIKKLKAERKGKQVKVKVK